MSKKLVGSNAKRGYCPACDKDVDSLPPPASGSCVHCYNHLLKLECNPRNLVHRSHTPTGKYAWRAED